MKAKITAGIFTLVVLAQLWVPASMIFSSEKTLKSGKAFKFKTAPVDPYDAFRGKYVALDFTANNISLQKDSHLKENTKERFSYGQRVYVLIGEDSLGFAEITGWQKTAPIQGYYVKVKTHRTFRDTSIRITYPFSRFFLEEGKAKQAEELYQKQNRKGKLDSYVIVRINLKGNAVLEDLVLGGTPILEALK